MTLSRVKEKIRALLAMSASSNDCEAQAAILKVREMMAKYKLSEMEINEREKQEIVELDTGISFSSRNKPWIFLLAQLIAQKHCCQDFFFRQAGKQTKTIGFLGFADDAEICDSVLQYAVDCATQELKNIQKRYKEYPVNYRKTKCDSYGYGFVHGIQEAFEDQDKAHQEWGLLLTMSKEIKEIAQGFETENVRVLSKNDVNILSQSDDKNVCNIIDFATYGRGRADGRMFHVRPERLIPTQG